MEVEMELTQAGLKKLNALIDDIEETANSGIFGEPDRGGYLVIKSVCPAVTADASNRIGF